MFSLRLSNVEKPTNLNQILMLAQHWSNVVQPTKFWSDVVQPMRKIFFQINSLWWPNVGPTSKANKI